MRKLTVKNFSVIKDAELEFGKITVLIGPQSSGKSLLCKLAYFFSKEVLEIAEGRIRNEFSFPDFQDAVAKRFSEWFPASGWGHHAWALSYVSGDFEVSASGHRGDASSISIFNLAFGKRFEQEYFRLDSGSGAAARILAYLELSKLMERGIWQDATYIPSERSYFVDIEKGYRLLASQSDPIANRFAEFYPKSLNPETTRNKLKASLQGELLRGGESWLFSFVDGRVLPLNFLSTGSKELLPLFCALETYSNTRRGIVLDEEIGPISDDSVRIDEFFVEEPEAHIFPKKQYEIVQYFAELLNNKDLRASFTITTHSPYILTAFNSLIEAWRVGNKEGKREQVAALIPERYWVNENDFAAYSIRDGKLESIFKKETDGEEGSGLIDGDFLDSVSDSLGSEFDKLLDIEYAD